MEKLRSFISLDPTMDSLLGPEYESELILINRDKLYIKLISVWGDLEDLAFAYIGDMPRCEVSVTVFDEIIKDAERIPFEHFEMHCCNIPGYDNDEGLSRLLLHLVNDVT